MFYMQITTVTPIPSTVTMESVLTLTGTVMVIMTVETTATKETAVLTHCIALTLLLLSLKASHACLGCMFHNSTARNDGVRNL